MAEENSAAIEQRTHSLLEKSRSTLKADDIDAVERTVAIWVQENKLLRSKRPAEFIRTTTDPGHCRCFGNLPRAARPKQRRKQSRCGIRRRSATSADLPDPVDLQAAQSLLISRNRPLLTS